MVDGNVILGLLVVNSRYIFSWCFLLVVKCEAGICFISEVRSFSGFWQFYNLYLVLMIVSVSGDIVDIVVAGAA